MRINLRRDTFISSFGTLTRMLDEDPCRSKTHTATRPNNICASVFKGFVNFFTVVDTCENIKI